MKNNKHAQTNDENVGENAAATKEQTEPDGVDDNAISEAATKAADEADGNTHGDTVETATAEPENSETAKTDESKPQKQKRTAKQWIKYYAHRYFIEAFSGMALGLFCTLIIGTIIAQFGTIDKDNAFCKILANIGNIAKVLMGAGIGVGIAHSLKANKLTSFSTAVAGAIGAYITNIFEISGIHIYGASSATPFVLPGDPVGAFVASVAAIEVTRHVEGKTPVDIIVVPLVAIISGTLGGIALGIPFGMFFAIFGKGVSMAIGWEPISFGILIAVIMGLLLTLPTSSAAFGVMIFNSPLINTPELAHNALIGAAAACAGCCAHMVGFAVASFRENRWGGLVSQGLGTSMLQIPNLGKNPRILVPAVVASAVAGPLASAAFKIMCDATGAGMGTAGLVGVISTFTTSIQNGMSWWYVLIAVLVCYVIVPGLIAFGMSELMRKLKWIKRGDMKI